MNRQYRASVKAVLTAAGLAVILNSYSTARGAESKGTEIMPATQQNAVVQRYCGSCHSDSLMYGGLSVEHFDAAHPDPSLAAMLVSKLTSGRTARDIDAAAHGPDSAATILLLARGAMGAAGDGVPDEATQVAFAKALSAEAAGAEEWNSQWSDKSVTQQSRTLTAAMVRELPSTVFAGKTDMYRLILTCRGDTHEGEIKLAWANGVPDEGQEITVEVDGKAPITHKVEGGKKQGNGINGPGATVLYPDLTAKMPIPSHSLTVKNVFPDETVVFPFENLSQTVREDLSACFTSSGRIH
jgi:hypothetical protein